MSAVSEDVSFLVLGWRGGIVERGGKGGDEEAGAGERRG